ncbi:MAG: FtsW/RodA/SpoVE family cell cycle protein [bacterium]
MIQKKITSHIYSLKDCHFSLLFVSLFFLLLNLFMMFSTSPITGLSVYGDSYYFIKKTLFLGSVGLCALLCGLLFPLGYLKKLSPLFLISSFILLCLCFSVLGVSIGGAQRWLNLYVINLQPVELVKFSLVLFFAIFMNNKHHQLQYFQKGILPLLCIFIPFILLLLLQPDLGNTLLICLVLITLFFLSPLPLWQLCILCLSSLLTFIISVFFRPYQLDRILTFLSPDLDPFGKAYHINQSLLSVGSGGLWGLGLGQSKLKFFYLPLQYSDFIYSIICEEGGFILGTLVILFFLFFLLKCFTIAMRSQDYFQRYVVLGLGLFICYQAFINIAGVIALLPITGIPLTFVSFGGSSLVSSLFYLGIILNISRLPHKRVRSV